MLGGITRRSAMQIALAALAVSTRSYGAPARAGEPPAIELYGTLPKTEKLEISPNGEMFAAVFTVGDLRLLSVFKPDGTVLIKENVGKNQITGIEWAGDNYVIVYAGF